MAKDLSEKVNGIIENHTARRLYPVEADPVSPNKGDIVHYVRKNKVKKVGEGEDDFVIEEVVVESERYNRQQYIAKDADQVGVLNILEKVRRSGDVTLLNQTGAVIPEGVQDYTKAPHNVQEALNALQIGSNSFEGLKAIFGDVSFNELANMSSEQISAKLNAYVASQQQNKEGEVK